MGYYFPEGITIEGTMTIFGKIIAGLFGGLLFAFLAQIVVSLPFAASEPDGLAWLVWVFWAIAVAVVVMSPTVGKAWRRLLISCAVLSLAMPLSALVFSSAAVSQVAAAGGDQALGAVTGAAVGAGAVTVFTGVIGFFMAAIFLIIGLLVGRDKPATT